MGPQEHSPVGPSTWDRTIRCPGSLRASEGYPDDSGYEAAEGTVFHSLMALCLEHGLNPESLVGHGRGIWVGDMFIEYDSDMAEAGRQGLEYIREKEARGWTVLVEQRVDISSATRPGEFGTSDVIMYSVDENAFSIFDWKYGHKAVFAENSYQIIGYAIGAWDSFLWQVFPAGLDPVNAASVRVDLVIEQPRVPGAGGCRTMTLADLFKTVENVKVKFQQAFAVEDPWNEAGVINPGEIQCEYCRVREICKPRADWMQSFLDPLNGLPSIVAEPMSMERRAEICRNRGRLKKWLDEIYQGTRQALLHGAEVPGLKLVYGKRPPRKWKEHSYHKVETALEASLDPETEIFKPPELRSPTDIEKSFGGKFYSEVVDKFVDYGEKKLIMVDESDSREAVNHLDMFDDITESPRDGLTEAQKLI